MLADLQTPAGPGIARNAGRPNRCGGERVAWSTSSAPDGKIPDKEAARAGCPSRACALPQAEHYRARAGQPKRGRRRSRHRRSPGGSSRRPRAREPVGRAAPTDLSSTRIARCPQVPDREVADKAGVTAENVRAYRRRHSIPMTCGKTARKRRLPKGTRPPAGRRTATRDAPRTRGHRAAGLLDPRRRGNDDPRVHDHRRRHLQRGGERPGDHPFASPERRDHGHPTPRPRARVDIAAAQGRRG